VSVDESILRKAVDLLARREHSRLELRDKLRQRGFEAGAIERVLDRLVERGWLDDERFAEAYVRGRCERGEGPLRIAQGLRRRGIAEGVIARWLERPVEDWQALARRAWRKRFGGQRATDARERARQQRFLGQRGFDHGVIRAVLDDPEGDDGLG